MSNYTTEELLTDLLTAILGDDAKGIQEEYGNESAVEDAITTVLEWRKQLDTYLDEIVVKMPFPRKSTDER